MTHPQELRIGNIVGMNLKKYPNNWFVILEVAESNIKTTDDWKTPFKKGRETSYYQPEDFEGIPLTEEWLVKFGAVKTFENWQFTISVGAITLHFRRSTQWYSELGGIYLGSKIQYVHQLQNLYFALTGNELELK